MIKKSDGQIWSSIFFLAMGIGIWFVIPYAVPMDMGATGPHIFPRFLAVAMFVIALIQLVVSLAQKKKELAKQQEDDNTIAWDRKNELRVLLIFLLVVAYCIALEPIGYILSTLVFATALMAILKTKIWWMYACVYAFILLVYFVFTRVLLVSL